MSPPKNTPEHDSKSPFDAVKYSLPELLRDVKQDRTSSLFSMEKLDQDTISRLFEQRQSRRESTQRKK